MAAPHVALKIDHKRQGRRFTKLGLLARNAGTIRSETVRLWPRLTCNGSIYNYQSLQTSCYLTPTEPINYLMAVIYKQLAESSLVCTSREVKGALSE